MYKCLKCDREFESKRGLTVHSHHCQGKLYCSNPKCNKQIKSGNKYCSIKCAALVTTPGRRQTEETRKKISISQGGTGELKHLGNGACINCGKQTNNPKFCSRDCDSDYRYKYFIQEWLAGREDGIRNKTSTCQTIKRWLIETYGNKCSICGWKEINPITKNVPVELDHKSGDFTNNSPDNVRLLCPNCHSLTPTFRALNIGNGRKLKPSHSSIG